MVSARFVCAVAPGCRCAAGVGEGYAARSVVRSPLVACRRAECVRVWGLRVSALGQPGQARLSLEPLLQGLHAAAPVASCLCEQAQGPGWAKDLC